MNTVYALPSVSFLSRMLFSILFSRNWKRISDQNSLKQKRLTMAYNFQGNRVHRSEEVTAVGAGNWLITLNAHSELRVQQVGPGYKTSKQKRAPVSTSSPNTDPPPKDFITSLNSTTCWRPRAQTHKPVGDISIQVIRLCNGRESRLGLFWMYQTRK